MCIKLQQEVLVIDCKYFFTRLSLLKDLSVNAAIAA